MAAPSPALYPLSSTTRGKESRNLPFAKGHTGGALWDSSSLYHGVKCLILFSCLCGYISAFSWGTNPRCFTLWVPARTSETQVQISPPSWSSHSCLLFPAVRSGQVWGKCPAGYFCLPGTAGLPTQYPRDSETICPQGQLCARPCPAGKTHFFPLECERGREQGCPAVIIGPTQAKQVLNTQYWTSNMYMHVFMIMYVICMLDEYVSNVVR